MEKIWNSKTEMTKQYYHIVLTYIRKIRAFIFKKPEQNIAPQPKDISSLEPVDIPRQFDELFKLFEENRDISLGKLVKISNSLNYCLKRLDFKL